MLKRFRYRNRSGNDLGVGQHGQRSGAFPDTAGLEEEPVQLN